MSEENLDMIEAQEAVNQPKRKPFYFTKPWLVVWSILIWPIGVLMLWAYFANMHKYEMPRTKLIKEDIDEYYKP